MWANSPLKKIKEDQRGVSAIVGGLMMMSLIFGFTTFILAQKAKVGEMRARGLIDTMREAEKRQAQLIDFSYADENSDTNVLKVYLSNYGWEDAKIAKVWVAGSPINGNWKTKFATTGNQTYPNGKLPKRRFVKIVVSSLPTDRGSEYSFALLTESNAIYKWKVYG